MTRDDLPTACGDSADRPRCAADLPDNPSCATNFHFGLLLGVDELRTEQGYHLGRSRRHQRLLHGAGVVAGLHVGFDAETLELRVGPGLAIDAWGRDLVLERAQCVSLPRWWAKHRRDDAWGDIVNPADVSIDLELWARHDSCLSYAVPAIADACSGASSDIAYARVCDTVRLELRRAADPPAPTPAPTHRLLRVWLGQAAASADDQWLLDAYAAVLALPPADQPAARAALAAEVLAVAAAAEPLAAPEGTLLQPEPEVLLARLQGVHITLPADPADPADPPTASVTQLRLGVRTVLLPTAALQSLLLAEAQPPAAQPGPLSGPAAGPVLQPGGATLSGTDVIAVFNQPLAAASAGPASVQVSEFVPATGWAGFTVTASVDNAAAAGPTLTLALDRAPAAASLLRLTVSGQGPTPLLGQNLLPAGAPHPGADGRLLSTAITRA